MRSNSGLARRAEVVRPPKATPELAEAREAQRVYREERERRQRRSLVRGLVLLAVLALGWSVARAGMERVFVQGWWRQW
jgi:hypothetical protein